MLDQMPIVGQHQLRELGPGDRLSDIEIIGESHIKGEIEQVID
ncbi:hypothetical protein [Rhodococcus pyridinivorans]|nr:hypothetical protein [Rhodococcus pyridinivorans]